MLVRSWACACSHACLVKYADKIFADSSCSMWGHELNYTGCARVMMKSCCSHAPVGPDRDSLVGHHVAAHQITDPDLKALLGRELNCHIPDPATVVPGKGGSEGCRHVII